MSVNMEQTSQEHPASSTQEVSLREVVGEIQNLELDSDYKYKDKPNPTNATATAVLFRTPKQDLLLVKPKYASGAHGNCSVWMGAQDKKLYIRKIILDDIMNTTAKSPIETEVNLTVGHPNVPQIVHSVNHGPGPNPREFGEAVSKLTQQYVKRGERLPEWAVWKRGLTLLKVLQKIQIQDITHGDIRSRNILVSASIDENRNSDNEFHLIDFGIAKQIHGPVTGGEYSDNSLITEVLLCMMLNKPQTGGFKVSQKLYEEVQSAAQQPDWPYSEELIEAVWALHNFKLDRKIQPGIAVPEGQMRGWLNSFQKGLASHKPTPKEALSIQAPIQDTRPLLPDNIMNLTWGGGPACCPFRRAEIDTNTFEILNVSDIVVWGQYFADVCWKSDPARVVESEHHAPLASEHDSKTSELQPGRP